MNRRKFIQTSSLSGAGLLLAPAYGASKSHLPMTPVSVGMIGLDTSHCTAFTKILNNTQSDSGFRVTHAYPHGSRDIESSVSRIPRYTKEIQELGVSVVDSVDKVLAETEVILLMTNDGRRHLEQAEAVFKAQKKVFIDKPLAASLSDCVKIFDLAQQYQTPVFSASSLRFAPSTLAVREGKIGQITGADTYSPATIEKTHPDLFWYGVHGVEALFTIMGRGCKQVRRIHKPEMDVVVGEWEDGRIGTFRGIRGGKTGYGGTAYGTEGIAPAGLYEGYQPLVMEIMEFFKTGAPPVQADETLEIFAFMAAAEMSKRKKGKPVSLEAALKKAGK